MTEQHLATPELSEAAFYAAFQAADLQSMMAVWADDDKIACVHPGGPLLVGHAQVEESWRRILNGGERARLRVVLRSRLHAPGLAVHVVEEHLTFVGDEGPRRPVISTNVYRLTANGWRLVLHHAAPSAVRAEARETPARTVH